MGNLMINHHTLEYKLIHWNLMILVDFDGFWKGLSVFFQLSQFSHVQTRHDISTLYVTEAGAKSVCIDLAGY